MPEESVVTVLDTFQRLRQRQSLEMKEPKAQDWCECLKKRGVERVV